MLEKIKNDELLVEKVSVAVGVIVGCLLAMTVLKLSEEVEGE